MPTAIYLPVSQRPHRSNDGKLISDPHGAVRMAATRHCRKDPMPIGTVVIRREADAQGRYRYIRYIKVKMNGLPQRRWMQYSRWWWEKNRSPIPKGQMVLHKDGLTLNDDPSNLVLGGPGMKLVLAHQRDKTWSKDQHARAAFGCAEFNRRNGMAHRATNFLKTYWYPVVEPLGVILNVPFRKRKRVLGCFGVDVSKYPKSGIGKKPESVVQKAIAASPVKPVKGAELSGSLFRHHCVLDPVTRQCHGPMSMDVDQIVSHLQRLGIWKIADKYARKYLKERK